MENSTLRQLQLHELEILKDILKICDEHNIRTFALGGTLLGAVRHQGFIPWDDDIDIGIPRPDYERFLRLAPECLDPKYAVSYFKNTPGKARPVYACQILDTTTEIEQYIANKTIRTNIWVDVFPLDGMPDNAILRKLHSLVLLYDRMRIQFSMFDENVHQHRKNRPWYEKALIELYKVTKIGRRSDPYDRMYKLDRSLLRYDYDKSGYLINFMGAWKLKEMFPKSVYGEGKQYEFELLKLLGPADADAVLTQMYGDYMTPVTAKNEQEEHHSMKIIRI